MPKVVLYTRPGCRLCDEAEAEIASVRREKPFELRKVNIDLDPELKRRYGEHVPVVEVDGREAFRHRAGLKRFLELLEESR